MKNELDTQTIPFKFRDILKWCVWKPSWKDSEHMRDVESDPKNVYKQGYLLGQLT
jgi:hypothetical protein